MKSETKQDPKPAYISYKTFMRFINGLQPSGIPTHIDKSIMPKMSGGDQSAMLMALRYLQLVGQNDVTTQDLTQLVESSEETRPSILQKIVKRAYPFLFDGSIELRRATTRLVEDAFKAQGVTGSTVTKAIAFFLAIAKDAGLEISPHVKAPPIVRNTSNKRTPRTNKVVDKGSEPPGEDTPPGSRQLRLPLPGKPDVILVLPESFTPQDWGFLKPIMEAYVNRIFEEGGDLL